MSNPDTELINENESHEDDDGNISRIRREREQFKNERDELQAQLADRDKEQAFTDAGVPTDGPAKWFRQGYDGDMTADAIKEAAIADGIIEPPTPPAPSVPAEELAAHQRTSEVTEISEAEADALTKAREAGDAAGQGGAFEAAKAQLAAAGMLVSPDE